LLAHVPTEVAGDAGLRDLEDDGADLVAVADADLVGTESFDSELLAELSVAPGILPLRA